MSLPPCQERILSGIENALREGEPRLASRFAIFTRLTHGEELPRTEQLVQPSLSGRWLKSARLRAVLAVPVALFALAAALFFASITGSRSCPAMARTPHAVPTRWVPCTASGAAQPAAHSAGTGGTSTRSSHQVTRGS